METALRNGKIWPLQNQQTTLTGGQVLVPVFPLDIAVVPANNLRKFLQLTNDETAGVNNIIYLSLGAPAIPHTGIRLNLDGGTYTMTRENLFTGEIRGTVLVGGAPSVVTVTEGV
jgi:hypothetical protein